MERRTHTVYLVEGTDEAAFLSTGDAAGLKVRSNLHLFDGIIEMTLNDEEAETLRQSPVVTRVEEVMVPYPFSYPYPTTVQSNKKMIVGVQPNSINSFKGWGYTALQKLLMSDQEITASSGTPGYFTGQGDDNNVTANIRQNPIGRFVDIVCIEAGSGTTGNNGYETHRDYQEYDPETFNISFTPNGSSNWIVSGTDRVTSHSSASNPTLTFYPGDIIVMTNFADSSHPLEIVDLAGNQLSNVVGQGAFGGNTVTCTITEYDEANPAFRYRCSVHTGTMVGNFATTRNPASKFIPMDWSDYEPAMNRSDNNQITNPSGIYGSHALGVMSASAGTFCSWAPASSVRLIYLEDAGVAAYNAVLAWHNSKPINPVTGVRNATVTTGAWGFTTAFFDACIPIDSIKTINAYDEFGNLTVINRPGGGWGNDFTPFTDNYMIPRVVNDPFDAQDKWMIDVPYQAGRYTSLDIALNAWANVDGIYHFRSVGNSSNTFAKTDDPRYNNTIVADAGSRFVSIGFSGQTMQFSSDTHGGSDVTYYTLRTYDGGNPNEINVGAAAGSDTNPNLDYFSTRGPGVDLFGYGSHWWSSAPYSIYGGTTFNEGDYYAYFWGTSVAAPNAAGLGACFVEDFFIKRGKFPSIPQLRNEMVKYSKPRLADANEVDWSNAPSAGNITTNKLVSIGFSPGGTTQYVFSMRNNSSANGGINAMDMFGSPNQCAYAPKAILEGNGKYISSVTGPVVRQRPTTGVVYPRRKLKLQQ